MSFIITLNVREGIVMASDSRLTLSSQKQVNNKTIHQIAVGMSDSNYKTFLTENNIGISTFGAAEIQGIPIAGYIESFITTQYVASDTVEIIAQKILDHFRTFSPIPATQFHIAGYQIEDDQKEQHIWDVHLVNNTKKRLNINDPGAAWGGEGDILARLILPVAQIDKNKNVTNVYPHFGIPFKFFTLQDAIDFSVFAVRSTIESIRFQPRPKTVGGPIDVLVIKPEKAFWVQRKELKVS